LLLTYQPIQYRKDLVPKASLPQCAHPSSSYKRPQYRRSHNTYGSNSSLIYPALLTNHSKHPTSSSLDAQRNSRLHANDRLKIATFFHLDYYLILRTNILCFIALGQIYIHQVYGKPFDIYFF